MGRKLTADAKAVPMALTDPLPQSERSATDREAADAIRLLLFTGARLQEVLKAQWPQSDLEAGLWEKPSAHTKTKRQHRLELERASRAYMVRSLFGQYDKAIKADIAAASPIALRYMTAAAAKHRDDAYLTAVPLEDLVNNPDLYRTYGVDPQAYADKITEGAVGSLLDALGGQ